MSSFDIHVIFLCALFYEVWWAVGASRVLVVVPTPALSHQLVFRPFTQELARRGHQVVVLTTEPAFPPGQEPQNLTEIDLHGISYKLWTDGLKKIPTGKKSNYNTQLKMGREIMTDVFQKQIQSQEVRDMLSDKRQQFDLVVTEAWVDQALVLAYVYHAPAILMSSLGIQDELYEHAGVPVHPILYPDIRRTRRYNLSLWEQAKTLYNRFVLHRMLKSVDAQDDVVIRDLFGEDVPPLQDLRKNVESQLVNWHPMWEGCRPLTPNVVHLGGMNCVPTKELPEDVKSFLDSSKRGVIYMSFGTTANSTQLPPERLEVFARVFATLPYDVLWKRRDAPRSLPSNVHTFSWLPQPDLLRHEKLVLFITQGGLQSTDEALRAGVPLLGIPLLTDQWINVENYERLGVGIGLDFYTLSESQLSKAIETLINDTNYRVRSAWVGREMQDRAQSALARAVWRAERALRLRGRRMTTPPPPLTWDGLAQALLLAALLVPVALIFLAIMLYKIFSSLNLKYIITYKRCVSCARELYSNKIKSYHADLWS